MEGESADQARAMIKNVEDALNLALVTAIAWKESPAWLSRIALRSRRPEWAAVFMAVTSSKLRRCVTADALAADALIVADPDGSSGSLPIPIPIRRTLRVVEIAPRFRAASTRDLV